MRRRECITLALCAAASWSVAAHAEQPALPLIGFLHASSLEPMSRFVSAFKRGRQARNESKLYGVGAHHRHDRNRFGSGLSGKRRKLGTTGRDYSDLAADKFSR
jgi:hypothetical protein